MKDCLVYIFIIFLISFLLVLCVKDIEGFNAQKMSMETILKETDPSLAGSIDYVYTDTSMKNEDSEYRILKPEMYHNLLQNNKNFQSEKLPDKTTNLMNFSKKPDERFTEYYTYETILPPMKFMKPSVVQDLTQRPVISTNIRQDLSNNNERIYGLDGIDPENDCQGKWLPWDESNCPDSRDRCTLKFREYKVLKAKKSNGRDCTYEGDIIEDGAIEFDYCFGSGYEDRCGLEENACQCDLENYDADECEIESMEEKCICPAGYTLSEEGKCVSGSGTDSASGTNNLTQEQVDDLLVMLEQYKSGQFLSGSGIQLDPSTNNLGMVSLLRLAYAEGELQEAREIEARIQGDLTDEQRANLRQADENIIEDIIQSSRERQRNANPNSNSNANSNSNPNRNSNANPNGP